MVGRQIDMHCNLGEPAEISFVHDWRVRIQEPLDGMNIFGDMETFYTSYKSASHEWCLITTN